MYNLGNRFSEEMPWENEPWGVALPDVPIPFGASGPIIDALTLLTGNDVLSGSGRYRLEGGEISSSIKSSNLLVNYGATGSFGLSFDSYELTMLDIDGDGAADHVLRLAKQEDGLNSGIGTVYVKKNQVEGRSNLLTQVQNPLGGSFALTYTRTPNTVELPDSQFVLSRVEVNDGQNLGSDFASPNMVTTYQYRDGYFDRNEKEFFGFKTLIVEHRDELDAIIRYSEKTFENRKYSQRGALLKSQFFDKDGNIFSQVLNVDASGNSLYMDVPVATASNTLLDPVCLANLHPLLAKSTTSNPCESVFPILPRSETRTHEGNLAVFKRHVTEDIIIDSGTGLPKIDGFGNVLESKDLADDTTSADDVYAKVTYKNDTDLWLIGLPLTLQAFAGDPGGTELRLREAEYDDATGDLLALRVDTGSGTASSHFTYDSFGNLLTVTSPPNEDGEVQTLSYEYDSLTHSYLTQATDGFGYTASTEYDFALGVPLRTIDINGEVMERTYDQFVRTTSVRGPYDGVDPSVSLEYFHDEARPRAKTTNRSSPPTGYVGPSAITTVSVVDGLGRGLEVRKTSVVDVAGVPTLGMTTQGPPKSDTLGRTIASYHPFFTAGVSDTFVNPVVTDKTLTVYDALDRPRLVVFPDLTEAQSSYALALSPQGSLQHKITAIDPSGHVRDSFKDEAGRMVAFVEHPNGSTSVESLYQYSPLSELVSLEDDAGNITTMSYDKRGLWVSMSNPDTGLIQQQYDLMGNLTHRVEPNHAASGNPQGVHYTYDKTRLESIDYPTKPDVFYEYGDANAPHGRAGRLVKVTDETGSQEFFYGKLGEVLKTQRKVIPFSGHAMTFTTESVIDSLGRQLKMKYPDGEELTYQYDAGGALSAVQSNRSGNPVYIENILYDVFGNKTHAEFGNGVVSDWTYDPTMVRLETTQTALPSGDDIQNLKYTYDDEGNPSQIESFLPDPGPGSKLPGGGSWQFGYDDVDRLVSASGEQSLAPNKATSYTQNFEYSNIHNTTRKTRVHEIVSNGNPHLPQATNIDFSYAFDGPRPHAPTSVGDSNLNYDPSGNMISITKQGGGAARNFVWDDDNRMIEAVNGGTSLKNKYDAGGNRVVKKGRHGETFFVSSFFQFRDGNLATKHVFAGGMRVASVLAGFQPGGASNASADGGNPTGNTPCNSKNQGNAQGGAGGNCFGHSNSNGNSGGNGHGAGPGHRPQRTFYFHQDHLGSTNVLTDQNGELHEHLEYFPDGEL